MKTYANATPEATATALPPELPPAITQSSLPRLSHELEYQIIVIHKIRNKLEEWFYILKVSSLISKCIA